MNIDILSLVSLFMNGKQVQQYKMNLYKKIVTA